MKSRTLVAFGTRPEAIKMAPVVKALQAKRDILDVKVCVTGQHREMLDEVLSVFEIAPDFDLNIMRPGQDLTSVTTSILAGMQSIIQEFEPEIVLVHGDTTTAMATSMAAFYQRVKIGHVEAGLRSGNPWVPFPEEFNRMTISNVADLHFAPTDLNRQNLTGTGVAAERIVVTGNTVIDALFMIRDKLVEDSKFRSQIEAGLNRRLGNNWNQKPYILVTGHRRENFGQGIKDICQALSRIAADRPGLDIIYPVHLNPNVRKPVYDLLGHINNIKLIEPVGYFEFVHLMIFSRILLTDSGGIQEEAPSLGKPVLVMRDTTERPEAVDANCARLVGTEVESIYENVITLIDDEAEYSRMAKAQNPFGVGNAAVLIADYLAEKPFV